MATDTFLNAGQMVNRDDPRTRYRAGKIGLVLAATPTTVVSIIGSATKRIRVLRITVSGAAATASQIIPVTVAMYSTANTGGTATTQALVPTDSTFSAATAVVSQYTANPTTGTLVGVVAAETAVFALATAAAQPGIVFDFTARNGGGLVLNSVAETLAINFAGVTLANATTLSYDIEVVEE